MRRAFPGPLEVSRCWQAGCSRLVPGSQRQPFSPASSPSSRLPQPLRLLSPCPSSLGVGSGRAGPQDLPPFLRPVPPRALPGAAAPAAAPARHRRGGAAPRRCRAAVADQPTWLGHAACARAGFPQRPAPPQGAASGRCCIVVPSLRLPFKTIYLVS